ncbi:MAG TPA: rhodanese-like domain-containing protein, partial [Streptosporangiaceae bacterium]|nr:rhodanese-like domain-containing protein [Streptosporangiaceae bacterium]
IASTEHDVASAQRELVRIGIDQIEAAATGSPPAWAAGEPLSSYEVTDFAGYAKARDERPIVLLDVRRMGEWAAGRIADAVHIPLHELEARMDEVPAGEVWVHCAGGYRASVAASLLDAAGRAVVLISDHFVVAQRNGLAGP